MDYIFLLIFLFHLMKILKGELSLEIVKNINGTEVPAYDLEEVAGRNLTLTCKLVADRDTSNYFDDEEISWGWKRRNVQFDNVEDLEKLANNDLKPLNQFLEKSYVNQAVIHFQPLFSTDSGKYFCMSLKNRLFNIVKINVNAATEPSDLANYFKALDNSRIDFNYIHLDGPLSFPKFLCTNDMFLCKSGNHCFNYEHVCDNVKDCFDGSDENFYLCGGDPCEGKIRCSNGRCISESLCCDKFRDPDCTVNVKPLCCSENEEKYLSDWVPPVISSHDDFLNNFNKYDVEVHDVWNSNEKEESPQTRTLWIVVPCIIILILAIISIMVRQSFTKPANRSRSIRSPQCRIPIPSANGRGISPASGRISPISGGISTVSSRLSPAYGSLRQSSVVSTRVLPNLSHHLNGSLSRSISPNMNLPFDLPPSYDEAVANLHPNAPPLRNK